MITLNFPARAVRNFSSYLGRDLGLPRDAPISLSEWPLDTSTRDALQARDSPRVDAARQLFAFCVAADTPIDRRAFWFVSSTLQSEQAAV